MSETVEPGPRIRHHRTLFLSDLHLGAFGARADLLLRFLRANCAGTYLLVGDILDLGHPLLSRWSADHQSVIDHLGARKAAGARLIYVRGNHDPAPDDVPAPRRLPVPALGEAVHTTADGRRYLVIHGDEADARLLRSHAMTRLGALADRALRGADALVTRYIHAGAPDRRSAIEALIALANRGLAMGRSHERRLADIARSGGFDGVICGHFHLAGLRDLKGIRYANCGDWVDSFTALAEDFEGRLQLIGGRAAFAGLTRPALGRRLAPA